MEYTKDVILHVNYGQDAIAKRKKVRFLNKLTGVLSRHMVMTTVLSITVMLIVIDFMMVASFVQLLTNI